MRAGLLGIGLVLAVYLVISRFWQHSAAKPGSTQPLKLAIAAHLWMSPCVALPAGAECELDLPGGRAPALTGPHKLSNSLCGLVKWCADASSLARNLPALVEHASAPDGQAHERLKLRLPWAVDVVISTNLPAELIRAECPQQNVVIVPISPVLTEVARTFAHTAFDRDAALRSFQRKHKGRLNELGYALGSKARSEYDAAMLLKYALVGLTRYDLLVHTDLDVDLTLPPPDWHGNASALAQAQARVWAEEVPRFLASSERLLASLDGSGLINGGLVVLRPSAELYEEGIALLRTNAFSPQTGFNRSGKPSALISRALLDARDPLNASISMRSSHAMRHDDWTFVGAAADQGLLPLVFAARHASLRLTTRADYTLSHFYGRRKPWSKMPSCPPYYAALGLLEQASRVAAGAVREGGSPAAEGGQYAVVAEERAPGPRGSSCWPFLRQQAAKLVTFAASGEAERRQYVRACHGITQPVF